MGRCLPPRLLIKTHAPRSGTVNLQIETAAVAVAAWSTAAEQRCYLPGREEVPGPCSRSAKRSQCHSQCHPWLAIGQEVDGGGRRRNADSQGKSVVAVDWPGGR